jgi:hypothetical protein
MNVQSQIDETPSGQVVRYSFSPKIQISMVVDSIFESLFGVIFLSMATYIIDSVDTVTLWLSVLAMYSVAGIALSRVLFRARHWRSLQTNYSMDPAGVSIEAAGSEARLTWGDFDRAEYLTLIPAYRLSASKLQHPLVILAIGGWNPRSASEQRKQLTKRFLEQGLNQRLVTRWFPW